MSTWEISFDLNDPAACRASPLLMPPVVVACRIEPFSWFLSDSRTDYACGFNRLSILKTGKKQLKSKSFKNFACCWFYWFFSDNNAAPQQDKIGYLRYAVPHLPKHAFSHFWHVSPWYSSFSKRYVHSHSKVNIEFSQSFECIQSSGYNPKHYTKAWLARKFSWLRTYPDA